MLTIDEFIYLKGADFRLHETANYILDTKTGLLQEVKLEAMRRKILQDLANTVCQKYVDFDYLEDTAAFAHYGSGVAVMNFISGECIFNGKAIPTLKGCTVLKDWLDQRFTANHIIVQEIASAQMIVSVSVSDVKFSWSYGHAGHGGRFSLSCQSEIRTDEKAYLGQMDGEKAGGFGDEYYQLGCQPEVGQ